MSTTFSLVSHGLLSLAVLASSAQAANFVPYPDRGTDLKTPDKLVHARDTLVFVLRNGTSHQDLYFDATLNATHDPLEGQRFSYSDHHHNDLSFVFTNVSVATNGAVSLVPEPQSLTMLVAGLVAVVGATVRRRRAESMGDQARA